MSLCKNWCFTLNNATELEMAALKDLENHEQVSYIVFQLEQGVNETPHVQGYVQFSAKKRMAPAKRILSPRCHMEKANGSPQQNKDYCTKEEGRIEGPYEYGEMSIAGKRSDLEAIREAVRADPRISIDALMDISVAVVANNSNFVNTLRNLYSTPPEIPFIPHAGWQSDLRITLDAVPDPRTVHWYVDPAGNNGKSYFSRHYRRNGERGFIVSGGKHADVIYAYKKEKVVFFDFTREIEERVPYQLMEGFKNGFLFNSKYQSQALYFDVPHVVCFANFRPDESKLSADRWNIIEI